MGWLKSRAGSIKDPALFLLDNNAFRGKIHLSMDKEQAINEFLKSLRVALTNSLAYPKDHPYFQECVNAFRDKAAQLFAFISPIKVIFTPIFIYEGKCRPYSVANIPKVNNYDITRRN